MVFKGMPTLRAAWWSSATARSARPMGVFWKNTASEMTSSAPMSAAVTSKVLSKTLPPRMSKGLSGIPTSRRFTSDPHINWPVPSRMKFRPMVAMNRIKPSWLTR